MIAARQELDLRPQLERLDRLILRSEGIDPDALTFTFRPLWQMDAPAKAALALSKAQATQVYAGLNLWPAEVTARLVEAQLVADGTYPNAAAVFAEGAAKGADTSPTFDFDPAQPRDPEGRWAKGASGGLVFSVPADDPPAVAGEAQTGNVAQPPFRSAGLKKADRPSGLHGLLSTLNPIGTAHAETIEGEEENRNLPEEVQDPTASIRIARYVEARRVLREIDPTYRNLESLEPPGYIPTEVDIATLESATKEAVIARTCDFLRPDGKPIGQPGTSSKIRVMPGGIEAAQRDYDDLSLGGTPVPFDKGSMARLPYGAGTVVLRPVTSAPGSPAVDIKIPGVIEMKLHYWSTP